MGLHLELSRRDLRLRYLKTIWKSIFFGLGRGLAAYLLEVLMDLLFQLSVYLQVIEFKIIKMFLGKFYYQCWDSTFFNSAQRTGCPVPSTICCNVRELGHVGCCGILLICETTVTQDNCHLSFWTSGSIYVYFHIKRSSFVKGGFPH